MRALDTNVLVRYLVKDDLAQAEMAEQVLREPCFLSLSVLLESVWLLSSHYALTRLAISMALTQVLTLPSIRTIDDELVLWAVERFQSGADFADMVHLIDGRPADRFATFDRGIKKAAGSGSPMPIEILTA